MRRAIWLLVVLLAVGQTGCTRKTGDRMVKTVDGVEYAFRWCPPGTFTMGRLEEKSEEDKSFYTPHEVTLTKGFWMLETEVTVGMFRSFVKDTGYQSQGNTPLGYSDGELGRDSKYSWENPGFSQTDAQPVVDVSWADAVAFCEWLGTKTGMKISLPTEAQWEYACRAGTTGPFAGDPDAMGWCMDTERKLGTHPVGKKQPNAWGLYDMHGNAAEWCLDWFGDYPSEHVTNPTGVEVNYASLRVVRGGSWHCGYEGCSSEWRSSQGTDGRSFFTGFRPVGRVE